MIKQLSSRKLIWITIHLCNPDNTNEEHSLPSVVRARVEKQTLINHTKGVGQPPSAPFEKGLDLIFPIAHNSATDGSPVGGN